MFEFFALLAVIVIVLSAGLWARHPPCDCQRWRLQRQHHQQTLGGAWGHW